MREFIQIPGRIQRWVLTGEGRFRREDGPPPDLGPQDLLFRLITAGITPEDVEPDYYGDSVPPGVPVAEIAAVGDAVSGWQPLDRALLLRPPELPNLPPFEGLATYVHVPEILGRRAIDIRLPQEISAEDATLIPAAAAAARLLREADVPPGGRLLVIGLGLVGQIAILMARHQRVDKILAADFSNTLRQKAEWNGAMATIPVPEVMISDVVAGALETGGVHAAIVLASDISLVHQAQGALTAGGTLVLGTTFPEGVLMTVSPSRLQSRAIRIQGVARFEEDDIDEALAAIKLGIVNGETLVTKRVLWNEMEQLTLEEDYWDHGLHVVVEAPEWDEEPVD